MCALMRACTHLHTSTRTHIWGTVRELISFGECRFHVSPILTPTMKLGCFKRPMELREQDWQLCFSALDVSEDNPSPLSLQLHDIQPLQGPPFPIFPTLWIIDLILSQIPKLLESKWHLSHPPQDELMRNSQLVPLLIPGTYNRLIDLQGSLYQGNWPKATSETKLLS